jgi:hypothetical protein
MKSAVLEGGSARPVTASSALAGGAPVRNEPTLLSPEKTR